MSTPSTNGPRKRPLDPADALRPEFDKLTHHKLPHDFLEHRLARLGKSGGWPKAEDEDTKTAFAALAKIMRTNGELGDEVIDYIALRTALHKPFRDYLRETHNGDLASRLDGHTIRRALL